MSALIFFNPVGMQAQDCIDIEQIKTDLSNIQHICGCSVTEVLGETDQTTLISTYQLGYLVQGACFEVRGTVVIDEPIFFLDCDFIFDDGALIRLQDDIDISNALVSVIFQGCNLQSCDDKFWDGIDIGARNDFYFWDNTMQHALNGIHSYSGPSSAFVTGNIFNDNHKAINLGMSLSSTSMFTRSGLSLNGNVFAQTNELKVHWRDQHWEYEESYGVAARNSIVNSFVGNDPCNRTNIFISLVRGYDLTNSISQIHADLFRGPVVYQYWDPEYMGIGIWVYNDKAGINTSSLIQSGWPTNHIATFDKVPKPISTLSSSTDVRDNIITNTKWGISSTASFMISSILDNDIQTEVGPGIEVFGSMVSSQIERNSVEVNHDSEFGLYNAIGILVWDFGGGDPLRVNSAGTVIRENFVDLNPGYVGIKTIGRGIIDFKISCNDIFISEALLDVASGITINGGQQNLLRSNNIVGMYSSTDADEVNGIKIVGSPLNRLEKNHTRNTLSGFHFDNWNNHTIQLKNRFQDHDHGYFISESGMTGEQMHVNNHWLGTFSEWAALNEGDERLSPYEEFQNLVSTVCWPQTISPDPGWFFDIQGSGNCDPIYGASDCDFEETPPELEALTYIDTLIARGELEFSDFEPDRIWQAEMSLLQNLIDFPDLVGSPGSLMDSFLTNVQTTVLWHYHELRSELREISTIPEGVSDDWFDMYDEYQNLIQSAELATDNLMDHPDSLELIDPITAIYEEIDSIWTVSQVAFQTWRTKYLDDLDQLLPDILALSTPNTYAANEKLILEASVRLAQNIDSVSSSLKNQLIDLAEGCLLENGPALFDARVILHQLDVTPEMYVLNCKEASGERRAGPQREVSSTFKVFPNPSMGLFTLKFNAIPVEGGWMEVYNRNGQLVHSAGLQSGIQAQEFSLDHLPAGHYNIRVTIDGETESNSLIISR